MPVDPKSFNRGPEASCSGRSTQLQTAKSCQLRRSGLHHISGNKNGSSRGNALSKEAERHHAVLESDLVELIGSSIPSITPLGDVVDVHDHQQSRSAAETLNVALRDG